MARPRPVPLWLSRPLSVCEKNWNSFSCSAGSIPLPVSSTVTANKISPADSAVAEKSTWTLPRSVNLIALPIRLSNTTRSLVASPCTDRGKLSLPVTTYSSCFASALSFNIFVTSSTCPVKSNTALDNVIFFDSILAISSTSLINVSICKPLRWIVPTYSRFRLDRSPSPCSNSEYPKIALSGVRSSWLMLARKAPLVSLASCASICACLASRFICSSSLVRSLILSSSELISWQISSAILLKARDRMPISSSWNTAARSANSPAVNRSVV